MSIIKYTFHFRIKDVYENTIHERFSVLRVLH